VLTDVENNGNTGDTGVYTGSGLCEDKNPTSYVRQCFIICWVKAPLPLLLKSKGWVVGFIRKVEVGYSFNQLGLYLYLPILQDLPHNYLLNRIGYGPPGPNPLDRVGRLMVGPLVPSL
jgi:hypothetical protein